MTNGTGARPQPGKPHIHFHRCYWRVAVSEKKWWRNKDETLRFRVTAAYNYVASMNMSLHI